MKILITGTAGFIGFHTARQLLDAGHEVIGLDNINDYYDPQIKYDRLALLEANEKFSFHKRDLVEGDFVTELITGAQPDRVINLAAFTHEHFQREFLGDAPWHLTEVP